MQKLHQQWSPGNLLSVDQTQWWARQGCVHLGRVCGTDHGPSQHSNRTHSSLPSQCGFSGGLVGLSQEAIARWEYYITLVW